MKIIRKSFVITILCIFPLFALPVKAIGVDSISAMPDNYFKNEALLADFFNKLYNLEVNRTGKINIVHIGDSHVQADFFTDVIRQAFQERFGNGGYGFTFPYSLAKTNGTNIVTYKSNIVWKSIRNIEPISNIDVGLGGIGIYTHNRQFKIELSVKEKYSFNTIKVLSATKNPCFTFSYLASKHNIKTQPRPQQSEQSLNAPQSTKKQGKQTSKVFHTVASKETLYRISVNNNVSVEDLKRANNLTSNTIKVGQRLIIPIKTAYIQEKTPDIVPPQTPVSVVTEKDSVYITQSDYYSSFHTNQKQGHIYILPNNGSETYNLNGVVLENDNSGVIYHAIGINGTKVSDFNKHPLFFNQLNILAPDLIVISLGTNESFGKWSEVNFMNQINKMINNIRKQNINAPILIMTPPPSLFRKSLPNDFVKTYSQALLKMNDCIIWDLFSKTGGLSAPLKKGNEHLMARDKVHYTKEGYNIQGNLFSSEFLKAYNNYIKRVFNSEYNIR
ncbi:LysM peptidoglycan-binding domain-containing protein [Dysgonomonas sp. 216]|uniref:LysM peptidoglycan-binding domain-containing protein n=1 Tax=Dysgonomonas sp. 216 TaxID=2302934 RepID=UPI0013D02D85|nr:LysM peptidoglycan-binding domain-containing protein [Dysgonomonas sp. 216]NDW18608.1 LysM peptidoglycan-binding domain-containing protein [Dysgonomonas sp. 216]